MLLYVVFVFIVVYIVDIACVDALVIYEDAVDADVVVADAAVDVVVVVCGIHVALYQSLRCCQCCQVIDQKSAL